MIMYLVSGFMFTYLWYRTMRTTDGLGLVFLKILTGSVAFGSYVIFAIRVASEYGTMPLLTARAVATINPIILVGVGLYLNYLFHQKQTTFTKKDTKNIDEIKHDVKEVKRDVKTVKQTLTADDGKGDL